MTESPTTNKQEKQPETYILVRWVFLRLLGMIHLTAFGSYALQIMGLNGSHGISPTCSMLQSAAQQMGWQRYWMYPTVAWFNYSDAFLQGITGAGIAFSLLVVLGIATGPALLVLSILWLSLVSGGGPFTEFQSDGMLVEATVLSLFLLPWNLFEPPWPVRLHWRQQSAPPVVSLWLLRIMLFRIMFCSGIVKLLSQDPTWHNLTALTYHWETQPIPTPLAWYAHLLPLWFQKLSVIGTFVSELIAPLLIFAPRLPRIIAAALMALLHFLIALNGNYTFLNFLMIVLCITLLDDRLIRPLFPKSMAQAINTSVIPRQTSRVRRLSFNIAAVAFILLAVSQAILTISGDLPAPVMKVIILLSPFHIADSYGLFAVMTTSRPEIVFEGSNDGKQWRPYEFKYKPGDNLKRPPPWVAPHMPRLDWKLWFAAMEPVRASPWVLALVQRLLDGSPPVLEFFEHNPFPDAPPKYIRAFVYDYHFTNQDSRSKTGNWWWRDHKREYLPPLFLNAGKLEMASLSAPYF